MFLRAYISKSLSTLSKAAAKSTKQQNVGSFNYKRDLNAILSVKTRS